MNNSNNELFENFTHLSRLIRRLYGGHHGHHHPAADSYSGQGRVMAMLKLRDAISTKELSYLLGIRPQSLNELLNKLEKDDYIVRLPSETDKRVMLISLTDKGKIEEQKKPDFSRVFSSLNEDEQTKFNEYLERITLALKEQNAEELERLSKEPHHRHHNHKHEED